MKAPAELNQSAQLTPAQLREKLAQLEQQIAGKSAERERLREEVQRLVINGAGAELTAARERKLEELNAEIRKGEQHRGIFEQEITAAMQRECQAKFEADKEKAQQKAGELREQAEVLAGNIHRLVRDAMAFRKTLAEFDSALPGTDPNGFQRGELSAALMRRIEMAFYVESEGALRPAKMLESWYDLKQAGHGNLPRLTREYTEVALRQRTPARMHW
jgi:hypothetical protein